MSTPSSVLVPAGRSVFTRERLLFAITGVVRSSRNDKTGPMVQISIVRQDGNPGRDLSTPRERAVCGDCPLRGSSRRERICYAAYVPWLIGQHKHRWPLVPVEQAAGLVAGRAVRLGSYGDPAAVPFDITRMLLTEAASVTGYTHAWGRCDPRYATLLMASVETVEQARRAQVLGWRTFRIRRPGTAVERNEIICLAESRGVQCIDCGHCSGTSRPGKNVVITIHGANARRFVTR